MAARLAGSQLGARLDRQCSVLGLTGKGQCEQTSGLIWLTNQNAASVWLQCNFPKAAVAQLRSICVFALAAAAMAIKQTNAD